MIVIKKMFSDRILLVDVFFRMLIRAAAIAARTIPIMKTKRTVRNIHDREILQKPFLKIIIKIKLITDNKILKKNS